MAVTAAELQAVLGVDTGNSESTLKGFDSRLGKVGGTAGRVSKPLGKMGRAFGGARRQAMGFMTATLALAGIEAGFSFLTDSVIGMNSTLEKSELQFTTLMGSSKRAKKHVKSLFEFAKKTPFETQPIIDASKHLQTFGGNALNNTKTLTLLGDAAASVSQPFEEVALNVGKMYGNLQVGKPVGETVARLQEMGLITPKVRLKIEKMQKAGKKGSAIWKMLKKDLGKYSGAMEKQAGTWEGLTSTLIDTVQLTLAEAFLPLFEGMKGGLEEVINFLSDPRIAEGLTAIGQAVMSGIGFAIDILKGMFEAVQPILQSILDLAGPVMELFQLITNGGASMEDEIIPALGNVVSGLGNVASTITSTVLGALGSLAGSLASGAADLAGWVLDGEDGLVADLQTWESTITGAVSGALDVLFGESGLIKGFISGFSDWVGEAITAVEEALPGFLTGLKDWIVETAPTLGTNLGLFATEFVGWVTDAAANLVPKLASFLTTMITWVTQEGIPGLVNAVAGFGQGLIDGIMSGMSSSGQSYDPLSGMMIDSGAGSGLADKLQSFFTDTAIPAIQGIGETLIAEGLSLGGQLATGVINGLIALPGMIIDFVGETLIPGILSFGESMTTEGEGAGTSMVDGFLAFLGELPTKFMEWVNNDLIPGISEWLKTINTEGMEGAGEFVQGFLDELPEFPGKVVDFITGDLVSAIEGVAGDLLAAGTTIAEDLVQGFVDEFPGFIDDVSTFLTRDLLPEVGKWANQLFTKGASVASDLVKGFVSRFPHFLSSVISWFTDELIPGIVGLASKFWSAARKLVGGLVSGFVGAGTKLASQLWTDFKNWWNQQSLSIDFRIDKPGWLGGGTAFEVHTGNLLPQLETGAWNIGSQMAAILHPGEMVVPRPFATDLRAAMAGVGRGEGDIIVNIENFYGTRDNIRQLSRELGRHVRDNTVVSYSAGARSAATS
jgi:hypothetical protein